jgi:hypothetical protein
MHEITGGEKATSARLCFMPHQKRDMNKMFPPTSNTDIDFCPPVDLDQCKGGFGCSGWCVINATSRILQCPQKQS